MIEKVFWGEALAFLKPGRRGIFRTPFLYMEQADHLLPERAGPRLGLPSPREDNFFEGGDACSETA